MYKRFERNLSSLSAANGAEGVIIYIPSMGSILKRLKPYNYPSSPSHYERFSSIVLGTIITSMCRGRK